MKKITLIVVLIFVATSLCGQVQISKIRDEQMLNDLNFIEKHLKKDGIINSNHLSGDEIRNGTVNTFGIKNENGTMSIIIGKETPPPQTSFIIIIKKREITEIMKEVSGKERRKIEMSEETMIEVFFPSLEGVLKIARGQLEEKIENLKSDIPFSPKNKKLPLSFFPEKKG